MKLIKILCIGLCTILVAVTFFGCGGAASEEEVSETESFTVEEATTMGSLTSIETISETTEEETTRTVWCRINEIAHDKVQYTNTYQNEIPEGLIDQLIAEWDASSYDYTGMWETWNEEEYLYEVNLYFEKRITYSTADASYLDGEWCYINEPSQVNSLYEGVHCITDTGSAQWAWLCSHDYYFDAEGIGMYDGRVMVALTPAFGGIGDYVDLLLADGSILPCVICDHKGNAGTWGHWHGDALNVIEIMVAAWWYDGHENKWYPDVIAWR